MSQPPSGDEIGLAAKIMGGVLATFSALAIWAWNHTHKLIDAKADKEAFEKRVSQVEEQMIAKTLFEEHVRADEHQLGHIGTEMSVQRGHIAKLFDKLEELNDKTETKFTVLERIGTERHIELLTAIHSLSGKK